MGVEPCGRPRALSLLPWLAEKQGGRSTLSTLPGSPGLHRGALITTIMEPDCRSSQATSPSKPPLCSRTADVAPSCCSRLARSWFLDPIRGMPELVCSR